MRNVDTEYHIYMGLNNVTIDICNYMNGNLQSLLMDMFLNDVKQYGNVIHRCPYAVCLI